jgi:propionyl-CoA carboxylase alpha chain
VAALRHEEFLDGSTTTDFIERLGADLVPDGARAPSGTRSDDEPGRAAIAAAMWIQGANRVAAPVLGDAPSGWRNARLPRQSIDFVLDGGEVGVTYARQRDGAFVAAVGGGDDQGVRVHDWRPGAIDLEIDGGRRVVPVTRAGDRVHVQSAHGTVELEVVPRFVPPGQGGPAGGLTAPMPGVVLEVRVGAGDEVEAGQVLVVLEAMKMEHHIRAPGAGTVSGVEVAVGAQVENGAVLLVLDAGDDGAPEAAS